MTLRRYSSLICSSECGIPNLSTHQMSWSKTRRSSLSTPHCPNAVNGSSSDHSCAGVAGRQRAGEGVPRYALPR